MTTASEVRHRLGGPVRLRFGNCPATRLGVGRDDGLHELATNALKRGALSVPEGRVSIACATAPDDGTQVVNWVERGGPPIAGQPARRGFGLRLLGRGLAADAGVGGDLRFEPEGLRCVLRLPPPHPIRP